MTISPISAGNPVDTTSHVQQQQQAKPEAPAAKAETVSISKQAHQLASDGDTVDQEVREGAAEKGSETLKGKK
jgi:anti-sigma28 factor (negative regulator of flagellin synthesis)